MASRLVPENDTWPAGTRLAEDRLDAQTSARQDFDNQSFVKLRCGLCQHSKPLPASFAPPIARFAFGGATILPDDFLVKVDRASMAHGLEVRPPLLDHGLLELAGRNPSELKVHKGTTKWIFKEAFRERLPSGIVQRKKHGFEMPVDSWLRGPLRDMVEATVFNPNSRARDLIDQTAARKIYQAHLAGASRQGQVLWSLLILARWADRYLPVS